MLSSCRYMKSIFPQAEETIILETLYSNENNIQKTGEILKDMGYQKKDTVKAAQQKLEAKIEADRMEEVKKEEPPPPAPKIKTVQEKEECELPRLKLKVFPPHFAYYLIFN